MTSKENKGPSFLKGGAETIMLRNRQIIGSCVFCGRDVLCHPGEYPVCILCEPTLGPKPDGRTNAKRPNDGLHTITGA